MAARQLSPPVMVALEDLDMVRDALKEVEDACRAYAHSWEFTLVIEINDAIITAVAGDGVEPSISIQPKA